MTLYTRRASLGMIAAGAATPVLAESLSLDGYGAAIQGYDPVAYFEIQEATKGSWEIELETENGIWRFSRTEYRDLFEDNPDLYTPQFGGFDALGIARGFKRRSDATVWVMVDDKIYLHYTIEGQNEWANDIRGNIRLAEENWKDLRDQDF